MNSDDLLGQLEQLTPQQLSYLAVLAIFGPLLLRLLGFKMLATWSRPLALLVLVSALYAKQQQGGNGGTP